MGIEDELQGLDGKWKETAAGGGVQLPDGIYVLRINSAAIGKSQSSGRLQVAVNLTVVIGDHAGKTFTNYQGLDNEKSIGFFKDFMKRLEFAIPDKVSELPGVLPRMVGVTAEAQIKNKDGFLNIYWRKRVVIDPTATQPAGGGGGVAPKKMGM